MELQYFYLDENNLINFTRKNMTPMDCVINSLVLLKLIPVEVGEHLRYCSEHDGLSKEQVSNVFDLLAYNQQGDAADKFSFIGTKNIDVFVALMKEKLPNNCATLCGITRNNGSQHVITIFKENEDNLYLIDPHLINEYPYNCNIYQNADCENALTEGISHWWSLFRVDEPNPYLGSGAINLFEEDYYGVYNNLDQLSLLFEIFCNEYQLRDMCNRDLINFPLCAQAPTAEHDELARLRDDISKLRAQLGAAELARLRDDISRMRAQLGAAGVAPAAVSQLSM